MGFIDYFLSKFSHGRLLFYNDFILVYSKPMFIFNWNRTILPVNNLVIIRVIGWTKPLCTYVGTFLVISTYFSVKFKVVSYPRREIILKNCLLIHLSCNGVLVMIMHINIINIQGIFIFSSNFIVASLVNPTPHKRLDGSLR